MRFFRGGNTPARYFPVSYEEWEQRAKSILAAGPFDYVAGAAGAGDTMRSAGANAICGMVTCRF